jgi:hypothetical protein
MLAIELFFIILMLACLPPVLYGSYWCYKELKAELETK